MSRTEALKRLTGRQRINLLITKPNYINDRPRRATRGKKARWTAFIGTLAIAGTVGFPTIAEAVTGYHVVVGSAGLSAHSGPGTNYQVVGHLVNGQAIDISCQTKGTLVGVGLPGTPTDIWDQLSNGWYITDYYTSTPGLAGSYTAGIPQCGAPAPAPAPSFVGFPTSGSCPGLGIFAARGTRGSGDPATDHQDGQINAVGFKVLAEALPGGAAGPWYDPYTAPTIGTFGVFSGLNGLTASIEAGAADLAQTVNAFYQRCPRSAVLLDGYSSGAAAIKEAYLNRLNPSAADRGRTIVVLMGDPLFNGHDAADFPGTHYAQSDNGILAQWPFAFRPQLFPQAYAGADIADVCLSGDPLCNWPWSIVSPYSLQGIGYLAVHTLTHINGYKTTGPPGSTYYFPGLAAQWAGQRYRQMVSAGMVS